MMTERSHEEAYRSQMRTSAWEELPYYLIIRRAMDWWNYSYNTSVVWEENEHAILCGVCRMKIEWAKFGNESDLDPTLSQWWQVWEMWVHIKSHSKDERDFYVGFRK